MHHFQRGVSSARHTLARRGLTATLFVLLSHAALGDELSFEASLAELPAPPGLPPSEAPGPLVVGDFDGDLRPDAAYLAGQTPVVTWGPATYRATNYLFDDSFPRTVEMLVLPGESGAADRLVTSGPDGLLLWEFVGAGGGFHPTYLHSDATASVTYADLDGDGSTWVVSLLENGGEVLSVRVGATGPEELVEFSTGADLALQVVAVDWLGTGSDQLALRRSSSVRIVDAEGEQIETFTTLITSVWIERLHVAGQAREKLVCVARFPLYGFDDWEFLAVKGAVQSPDPLISLGRIETTGVTCADIDGDGNPEAVVAGAASCSLTVFTGQDPAAGVAFTETSFSQVEEPLDAGEECTDGWGRAAVCDLDLDGDFDVLAARPSKSTLLAGTNRTAHPSEFALTPDVCVQVIDDPATPLIRSLRLGFPSSPALGSTVELLVFRDDISAGVGAEREAAFEDVVAVDASWPGFTTVTLDMAGDGPQVEYLLLTRLVDAAGNAEPDSLHAYADGGLGAAECVQPQGLGKGGKGEGSKTEGIDPRTEVCFRLPGPPPGMSDSSE